MQSHIVYVSDFSMGGSDSSERAIPRSGYSNIGIELCRRLVGFENEVKVLGLGYTGQEHREPFSIIPCATMQDVVNNADILKKLWRVDVVVIALDIHIYLERFVPIFKKMEIPCIAITPLESDPLCVSWANLLQNADKVFFISEFGTQEAIRAGVDAEHIEIGIDSVAWRLRTQEEYSKSRKSVGIQGDEFVILTVADNQERKNLAGGMEIVSQLKKYGIKFRHILVTREESQVGWKLYDLAYELGMSSELLVFKSGIPFSTLYSIYCMADVFLLCSLGEGLGLPIMESMCVGVPVVANQTGAIPELLAGNRGWIVPYDNYNYNPFGNQRRYWIDKDRAVEALLDVKNNPEKVKEVIQDARHYMEGRIWERSGLQLESAIEKVKAQKK